MGELDLAESLQERRHVHAEAAAIALAQAVPPVLSSQGVVCGSCGHTADSRRLGEKSSRLLLVVMSDIRELGTILSIWAHPDDEAYLCGGIMAMAAAAGSRVVCATASHDLDVRG